MIITTPQSRGILAIKTFTGVIKLKISIHWFMVRAHETRSHKIKMWFNSKHFLGLNKTPIHFWVEMCVIFAHFDILNELLAKYLQGFTLFR